MLVRPPIGENLGPDILDYDYRIYNRTGGAVTPGTWLFADIERSQPESTNGTDRDHPGFFMRQGVLCSATAAGRTLQALGLCGPVQNTANVADNAEALIRVTGLGPALAFSSAAGNPLVPTGARGSPLAGAVYVTQDPAVGPAAGFKVPFLNTVDNPGGASPVLVTGLIFGIYGIR